MSPVSVVLLALSLAASGAAPVGPVGPAGPPPREERTKTFDQRQQGTTNIQAHLDNIVVILVPGNRISITDFAAKTEPEPPQHKPSPAVNKLLQQLSQLKSAPSSIEAQSAAAAAATAELFNSIPESKKDAPVGPVHVAQIASIPMLQTKQEPQLEAKEDAKPVAQSDGVAKKFPFQIDSNPLEIPVLVIQDS